ncbi:MAG: flagellar filament capping protein FliD [Clostridiales bacterium]|nr:flagellar filament capping protein FliD [Clostridiales bacterium]
MAINPINSPPRLTGLSSGMDTESIIKNMMRIEQIKLNRELRARTMLQWRQDALLNVSADLRSFKNTFLTTLGADGMLSSSTYTSYNVTLSGAMKDAVGISATSEAAMMKVTVNKIVQLASGGAAASSGRVSASGTQLSDGNYVKLGDLEFANDLFKDPQNGSDVNEISFEINGVQFKFDKDTTLHEMLSTVNNSEAGVTMSYSRLTDGFDIASKKTGAAEELKIVNGTGNAFGADSAFGIDASTYTGANAVVYINGIRVERDSNNFNIDGIRYTLNYVTGTETAEEIASGKIDASTTDPAVAVTAALTKNVDASMDKIKKFIEGYNAMTKKLTGLLTEKKNNKYFALTEEEKAEMTDSQIEQWENFAKSGLLRSDRDIQNLLSNMRAAFYSTVQGVGLSPQQIGLRTGSYVADGKYSGGNGEISLDESALRAALEKDSDAVMRVFMDGMYSNDPAERGLLYRLSDIIDYYTRETQYNTLNSLDRDMRNLANKIDVMEQKMIKTEERYYVKYAAMEQAMAKMNSQLDWINSVFASMNNNNK